MAKSKPVKDFEKKVVKVGKLKKGPANKTDTSFTSKKVVIRAQNLNSTTGSGTDEAAILTRIRAILPNCGHYNANMRKDATLNILKSLKELENLHSSTFLAVLDPIFVATFRQICDDEINVRSALLGLLTFLFENLKKENVAGFFPRWISFLNLASSHIKPEIRRDSVRFIGMTLRTQKALFVPYLHTILPSMVSLLTQYPQRSGSVPAFDCTISLIDAYCEPFLTKKEIDGLSRPLYTISWSNQTRIDLIRPSPFASSQGALASNPKPQSIPETALISIVSHLANLSISLWLDTAHLLNKTSNSTNTTLRNSTEFRQLQELLSLYRKLFNLVKFSAGTDDENELFWSMMPVKLVKNYKVQLKEMINK